MTRHISDDVVLLEKTPPGRCELCDKHAELRPYGPNGANVCFSCGMQDESETDRQFRNFLLREGPTALSERERLFVEVTETICRLMERKGVTDAQMAQMCDITTSDVKDYLGDGAQSMTLATLCDMFVALGYSAHVTCEAVGAEAQVFLPDE